MLRIASVPASDGLLQRCGEPQGVPAGLGGTAAFAVWSETCISTKDLERPPRDRHSVRRMRFLNKNF
jgi:hypothetical protein